MSVDLVQMSKTAQEAHRQIDICNACRYCEGFCSVFQAISRERSFVESDMTQLANLCHNCRNCYYACQYTEPHEFALNIPEILAEVRADSWERLARPQGLARLFQQHGAAMAGLAVLALTVFFWLIYAFKPAEGAGFYAYLTHNLLIAVFIPAFLGPLTLIGLTLRAYWVEIGGGRIRWRHLLRATSLAARMRNLDGGHGDGCNYEDGNRFTLRRLVFHQLTMWGFVLCFAATSSGTIMHYFLDWPAPYGFWTPPKLFGVPGGIMMVAGTAGLAWLKVKSPREFGAVRVWGGEMAFILLLGLTGLSGLLLYAVTGTGLVASFLALHLASVMTLFLLMPFSKMVHGFYRMAALVADAVKANP